MSSGARELEAFIGRVESLVALNEQVATKAAPVVADVVRENVAANVAPDGKAWPEKSQGGKALTGAGAALQVRTKGRTIMLSIGAPYVFHNWGAGGSSTTKAAERARKRTAKAAASSGVKSKFHAPRRQILPMGGEPLPEEMQAAVEKASAEVFAKAMGGKS